MEAVALWDFTASERDELSFSKGDTFNVVETDDPNWHMAGRPYSYYVDGERVRANGRIPNPQRFGLIPANRVQWTRPPWFHREISRRDADAMLMTVAVEGAFLVRDHYDGGLSLSVTVQCQRNQACGGGGSCYRSGQLLSGSVLHHHVHKYHYHNNHHK